VPLFELNRRPTQRQLRQFGVVCLVAFPLLGWLWGGGPVAIGVLAAVGLVLAIVGLAVPRALAPVFVGLSMVTIPIGLVVGELALLFIFVALFLPLGLVFRLIGRDALELKPDRSAETYWRAKRRPDGVARYYRQS
jgi:hypothetical protein